MSSSKGKSAAQSGKYGDEDTDSGEDTSSPLTEQASSPDKGRSVSISPTMSRQPSSSMRNKRNPSGSEGTASKTPRRSAGPSGPATTPGGSLKDDVAQLGDAESTSDGGSDRGGDSDDSMSELSELSDSGLGASSDDDDGAAGGSGSEDSWIIACEPCGQWLLNQDDDAATMACSKCGKWQHTKCWSRYLSKKNHPVPDWNEFDFYCWSCNSEKWAGLDAPSQTTAIYQKWKVHQAASKTGRGSRSSPESPPPARKKGARSVPDEDDSEAASPPRKKQRKLTVKRRVPDDEPSASPSASREPAAKSTVIKIKRSKDEADYVPESGATAAPSKDRQKMGKLLNKHRQQQRQKDSKDRPRERDDKAQASARGESQSKGEKGGKGEAGDVEKRKVPSSKPSASAAGSRPATPGGGLKPEKPATPQPAVAKVDRSFFGSSSSSKAGADPKASSGASKAAAAVAGSSSAGTHAGKKAALPPKPPVDARSAEAAGAARIKAAKEAADAARLAAAKAKPAHNAPRASASNSSAMLLNLLGGGSTSKPASGSATPSQAADKSKSKASDAAATPSPSATAAAQSQKKQVPSFRTHEKKRVDPEQSESIQVTQEEMNRRREESRKYWENYKGFDLLRHGQAVKEAEEDFAKLRSMDPRLDIPYWKYGLGLKLFRKGGLLDVPVAPPQPGEEDDDGHDEHDRDRERGRSHHASASAIASTSLTPKWRPIKDR